MGNVKFRIGMGSAGGVFVTPEYTYIPDLTARVNVPDEGILSVTVHDDPRVRAVLFGFAPGEELSEHTSSQPAILEFLRGEAELTLGRDSVDARPGTWVLMSPGLPHRLRARTHVVMLLTLIKDADDAEGSHSAG